MTEQLSFDLLVFDIEGGLVSPGGGLLPGRVEFFGRLATSKDVYQVAFVTHRGEPLPASVSILVTLPGLSGAVVRSSLLRAIVMARAEPGRTLFVSDQADAREQAKVAGCGFMWAKDFF